MNVFLTVTALAILPGVRDRPDPLRRPGPPPVKRVAVIKGGGRVVILKMKMYHLIENGVQVATITRTWETDTDLKKVWACRTDGTSVGPKALAKLLKNRVKVLVSADGNKVHPVHLRGVKKGTLVLILPKEKTADLDGPRGWWDMKPRPR
jgi:hypothetical protein